MMTRVHTRQHERMSARQHSPQGGSRCVLCAGVNNQATAEIFTGQSDGDNVFVNVEAKKRPEDAPKVLNVNSGISRDHMPGYHW